MATKSISDVDFFQVELEADGNGGKTGTVTIHATDGSQHGVERHSVNLAAAIVSAATATGLSQANVTAAVREFVKALRNQARTAGGWS